MRLLSVTAPVAAFALLLPGTAAAAATPTTTTKTYAASTAVIANPGRGFFTYTETHLTTEGTGWDALDAGTIAEGGHTLVYRIFYLEKYATADTITADDLALIRADFATARAAGVKLVVRFAYTSTDSADAPVARVLKHIAQLGPILTANADIVTALQAGLVGRWGEWYYTDNFTATDQSDRKKVLAALLAATPSSMWIQVRTPAIKRDLVAAAAQSRVGIHDDCFLAGTDDYGTFPESADFTWMAAQSASMLVGGETCDPSDRSGWSNASKEMAAYHWTYLNPSFNTEVLDSWGTAGLTEASRRLGYRLRLTTAILPTRAKPGAKVTLRLTLTNDGYAAPTANRPVRVILTAAGRTRTVTIPADVRTWTPGKKVSLAVTFKAPATKGGYTLQLALPDPSSTLASKPAYAIQLANKGTWNAVTGRNNLGATLTVKS
ncbi:DUF4832 domain-containing protein [Actinoplanes sp. NPDC051851]|uniref:DUF4832 domain-containing protein n=1 Tax=Actinoplanes sp. NPDC051851 TaxID=3154753 RepID=UPI00343108FB